MIYKEDEEPMTGEADGGLEVITESGEDQLPAKIKKASRFNPVFFIMSGVWIYYNSLFVYNNRLFTGDNCFTDKALWHFIPLPGAMDNGSWLLLFFWLAIGLVAAAFQSRRLRVLLFYSSLFLGLGFAYTLLTTDTQCKAISRCGPEMGISIAKIQSKAFANLDQSACHDLATFQEACKEGYQYRTEEQCTGIVKSLILYRDAGIDIKPCQKELRDCRAEYFTFFHGFLSNDAGTAHEECFQKFPSNQTGQTQCFKYVEEWKKQGVKPVADSPQP